jgi:CubicO group peptidase (beta-lactamase class C family)
VPLIPALSLATAFALLACPAAKADIANRLEQIDDYVNAYVDMAAFDGVVLIVDGSDVVYRKAFGQADYGLSVPMSEDSVFRIASLSKQVTQAAIGRLVDRDILALESPLADFLPDFPNAKRISIGQLLAHTAGIAHTNQLAWMDMETPLTLDEIVAGLAGEPLLFSPGTDERYSNGGYALLAKVIEIASGVSFGSFIETEFTDHGFPSSPEWQAGMHRARTTAPG